MTNRHIRSLLVISAVFLTLSAFISHTLSTTGALPMSLGSKSVFGAVLSWLSSLFYYLPPILIALWAAHTIRPFRWISNKGLTQVVTIGIILLVAATLRTTVESFAEMAPHFPEFDNFDLPTVLSLFDSLFYSLVEISLLIFIRKRLQSEPHESTAKPESA